MRAAVYVRAGSVDDRSDSGTAQLHQVLDYVRARGWMLVHVLADIGKQRTGFDEMLERMSSGAYDLVVCHDVSRLYRRPEDEARFWEVALRANVQVWTVRDGRIPPVLDVGFSALMP